MRSRGYAVGGYSSLRRNRKMSMQKGQQYRCQNPNCRDEIEVVKNSREEDSNLRCHCGAKMKKVYSKPVFRELSAVEATARVGDITLPKSALASQNRE